MRTTCEFLDAVKRRHNIQSDYALAKAIGVTRAAISSYRVGRSQMDIEVSRRVAELLDLDPEIVAVSVQAERAKKPTERALWESVLEKLGGVAALLLLGIGTATAPSPSYAVSIDNNASEISIIRSRQRRRAYVQSAMASLNPLVRYALRPHPRFKPGKPLPFYKPAL